MNRRRRKKEWAIIVAAAVLFHALLFLSIKPEFFAAFKKTVTDNADAGRSRPIGSNVIVTIPIEIEDEPDILTEQNPVQEPRDRLKQPRTVTIARPPAETPSDMGTVETETFDVEALTGRSPETLPQAAGERGVTIPPRPVEITWPDTRRLRHCLGHQIDVRIEVDENGKVLRVEPMDTNHPPDCVAAAVESAGKIVFEPGRVDGQATAMWTEVRIDFRKKR